MRTLLALFLFAVNAFGQSNSGELRLKIVDPVGLGLRSFVEITSDANQFRQRSVTDEAGYLIARNLESYDLIVVGGGISGLASAYFYRKFAGVNAKILVLDNHDDFGGHAKRNEFRALTHTQDVSDFVEREAKNWLEPMNGESLEVGI